MDIVDCEPWDLILGGNQIDILTAEVRSLEWMRFDTGFIPAEHEPQNVCPGPLLCYYWSVNECVISDQGEVDYEAVMASEGGF